MIKWHKAKGRDYPWRNTNQPFHVLVAEFLLQQTHVRKVQDVYEELIGRYPSPADIAKAELDDLIGIIQPLGLSYRAERIKRCADVICKAHKGRVPKKPEELKRITGVGDYIANAVLCYAYGQPRVPIDTNVLRVVQKYFGIQSKKSRPHADEVYKKEIRALYPKRNLRTANLAILDFAGLICTAKKPKCEYCPLSKSCKDLSKL